MTYHPREKTAQILNWTLEKVRSVPYPVTLRWAFYRCVQELGLTKKQYRSFKTMTAKARKEWWNGWRPWTLVDDTREIYGGEMDIRSLTSGLNHLRISSLVMRFTRDRMN